MEVKFSKDVSRILDFARDEAMRTGSYTIGAGHIMLAILRHGSNQASGALGELGVDLAELKESMDSVLFSPDPIPYDRASAIVPGKEARRVLSIAAYETLKDGADTVEPKHLLLSLTRSGFVPITDFLYSRGLDYDILLEHFHKTEKLPRRAEKPHVDTLRMMGALGEQLSNIMSMSASNIGFLS